MSPPSLPTGPGVGQEPLVGFKERFPQHSVCLHRREDGVSPSAAALEQGWTRASERSPGGGLSSFPVRCARAHRTGGGVLSLGGRWGSEARSLLGGGGALGPAGAWPDVERRGARDASDVR